MTSISFGSVPLFGAAQARGQTLPCGRNGRHVNEVPVSEACRHHLEQAADTRKHDFMALLVQALSLPNADRLNEVYKWCKEEIARKGSFGRAKRELALKQSVRDLEVALKQAGVAVERSNAYGSPYTEDHIDTLYVKLSGGHKAELSGMIQERFGGWQVLIVDQLKKPSI